MDYINVHQYLNHWIAITFLEIIYLRDWSAFYSDSWTNTFYLPKLTLICFSLKVPGITCLLIMKTLWSTFDDTWSVHSTCHKAVPGVDGHVPRHFVQLLVKTENAPDEGKQDDVVKVHTVLKQWVLFDPQALLTYKLFSIDNVHLFGLWFMKRKMYKTRGGWAVPS